MKDFIANTSGLLLLGVILLVGYSTMDGFANVIDAVAYHMHKFAEGVRERHARRTATVQEMWTKQLERDGDRNEGDKHESDSVRIANEVTVVHAGSLVKRHLTDHGVG